MDVPRATLPAGTLSGAPKVLAMEIIDELEPVKRASMGGLSVILAGTATWIRPLQFAQPVIKDNTLHIQAGAGVVADSLPELEWQETMNKGRAVFRAVEMVRQGLDD